MAIGLKWHKLVMIGQFTQYINIFSCIFSGMSKVHVQLREQGCMKDWIGSQMNSLSKCSKRKPQKFFIHKILYTFVWWFPFNNILKSVCWKLWPLIYGTAIKQASLSAYYATNIFVLAVVCVLPILSCKLT